MYLEGSSCFVIITDVQDELVSAILKLGKGGFACKLGSTVLKEIILQISPCSTEI